MLRTRRVDLTDFDTSLLERGGANSPLKYSEPHQNAYKNRWKNSSLWSVSGYLESRRGRSPAPLQTGQADFPHPAFPRTVSLRHARVIGISGRSARTRMRATFSQGRFQ